MYPRKQEFTHSYRALVGKSDPAPAVKMHNFLFPRIHDLNHDLWKSLYKCAMETRNVFWASGIN